jgi:hypothetical protein
MHSGRDIRLRRSQEKMQMIGHQDPRKHTPSTSQRDSIQKFEPRIAIHIVTHDFAPLPSSARNVVKTIFLFDP